MDDALLAAARHVRERAYAPYSGYLVGAAVLDEHGRIHTGCNVENISYGLTICAERAAIARMVAEGGRSPKSIAVATQDGGTPCGMCLQTLAEFTGDGAELSIVCVGDDGEQRSFVLSELMPHRFASAAVGRTCQSKEGSI